MSRKRKSKHQKTKKPYLSQNKINEILGKEKRNMNEGNIRKSDNTFPTFYNYRPLDNASCPVSHDGVEVSSILPICPGAIVFLNPNYTTGALQYLEKRPLLVLSTQPDLRMNGVICCSIGHRSNPGIIIHLRVDDNHCVGGIDTSVIYPWALHSLDVTKISTVCGYLRPDIFDAVKRAAAYHLGLSTEVPPYMRDLQYNVEYFQGQDFMGFNRYVKSEPVEEASNVIRPDFERVDEHMESEHHVEVEEQKEESHPDPFVPAPLEEGASHIKTIVSTLEEQDIIDLLSRSIKISEFAKKLGVSESQAYRIRYAVDEIYVSYNYIKRIRGKIQGNAKNLKFLSDIEKVIFAIHGSPERLEMKETDFIKAKSMYIAEFRIDLNNKVKFPISYMVKAAAAIDMKVDVDISNAKL